MVVLEMATGKPAWPNPAVATFKICATEEMPPVPDSLSPAAHDFLEQVCEGAGHDPSLSLSLPLATPRLPLSRPFPCMSHSLITIDLYFCFPVVCASASVATRACDQTRRRC